ncbi:MAG: argininosuccinate synthase [Planctomycetes bacterium]|nr:argininosuccinate synthase [Planctomycetota bacterium]
MARDIAVLTYSGGVDSLHRAFALSKIHKMEVHTVGVDTGGITGKERIAAINRCEQNLGLRRTEFVDSKASALKYFVPYLTLGLFSPLELAMPAISAARFLEAKEASSIARKNGAKCIAYAGLAAHTARLMETSLSLFAPGIPVAPSSEKEMLSREDKIAELKGAGLIFDRAEEIYSIDHALWVSVAFRKPPVIAGSSQPEGYLKRDLDNASKKVSDRLRDHRIGFTEGLPISLDGATHPLPEMMEKLGAIAHQHGIGTEPGTLSSPHDVRLRAFVDAAAWEVVRVALKGIFEVVLTYQQQNLLQTITGRYAELLSRGQYYNPVMRDMEALMDSVRKLVSGEVVIKIGMGSCKLASVDSPRDFTSSPLLNVGSGNDIWNFRDAQGAGRLDGLTAQLVRRFLTE